MSLIINSSRNSEFERLAVLASPGRVWLSCRLSIPTSQSPHPCRMLLGPHPSTDIWGWGLEVIPKGPGSILTL